MHNPHSRFLISAPLLNALWYEEIALLSSLVRIEVAQRMVSSSLITSSSSEDYITFCATSRPISVFRSRKGSSVSSYKSKSTCSPCGCRSKVNTEHGTTTRFLAGLRPHWGGDS